MLLSSNSEYKIDKKRLGGIGILNMNEIALILHMLTIAELLSLSKTNKNFHYLIKYTKTINEKVWQYKFKRYFSHTYDNLPEQKTTEGSTRKVPSENLSWHDFLRETYKSQFQCSPHGINPSALKRLLYKVKFNSDTLDNEKIKSMGGINFTHYTHRIICSMNKDSASIRDIFHFFLFNTNLNLEDNKDLFNWFFQEIKEFPRNELPDSSNYLHWAVCLRQEEKEISSILQTVDINNICIIDSPKDCFIKTLNKFAEISNISPFYLSVFHKHPAAILLIKAGAKMDSAVNFDLKGLESFLLLKLNFNSVLNLAVEKNYLNIIPEFSKKNINFSQVNRTAFPTELSLFNQMPLSIAIRNNNLGMVKALVSNGTEIKLIGISEKNDEKDFASLHLAAKLGHVDILDYLLSCEDANVNQLAVKDNEFKYSFFSKEKFKTPLFIAMQYVQPESVSCLLEHGAMISVEILHELCKLRNNKSIKLLDQEKLRRCFSLICDKALYDYGLDLEKNKKRNEKIIEDAHVLHVCVTGLIYKYPIQWDDTIEKTFGEDFLKTIRKDDFVSKVFDLYKIYIEPRQCYNRNVILADIHDEREISKNTFK